MRGLARGVLPRAVFDFADGAAETETTLRRNEAAFAELALLPRPLRGAASRDTSISLFGHRLAMPLIVGPTGLAGLFWPDGECCTARAASEARVGFCLSHASVATIETVATTSAVPRWMQVFIYKDRGFTRELAERAKAAGYHGLVLTIDNQLTGNRERDVRNGFTIPPKPGFAGIADTLTRAGWLWRMRGELPRITFGNYVRPGEPADAATLAGRMGDMLDPGMTWRDVDDLRRIWDGPLLLKGILHPDDAAEAVRRGIDGIIVSNHGGRQLDGAAAPIEVLAGIADATAGAVPLLLDGGVRRGVDIVKALALGATACLIGRPQLWGLAVAGQAGVGRILEIYRSELDRVMGLCGFSRISDIDRTVLLAPPRPAAFRTDFPTKEPDE
jgi:L-lactate dehydrogenase (cytochrome)/(S)-mandelate dehydrogenase